MQVISVSSFSESHFSDPDPTVGESSGEQTTGALDINRGVPATVMSVMSFASERAPEEDRDIIFPAGAEPVLSSKNFEN